jgi:hypothetical protein
LRLADDRRRLPAHARRALRALRWIAFELLPDFDAIEHWSFSQHIWKYHEGDLRAANEDVVDLAFFPVARRLGHILSAPQHVTPRARAHIAIARREMRHTAVGRRMR